MEHFYRNIHGWFDFQQLYTDMVTRAPNNAQFVEVGAFYGQSSAYMAVEIANSGKNITFNVVDTWRGSPEHQEDGWDRQEAMINDTAFDIFVHNMKPAEGYYKAIKLGSVDAAKTFEDESLDFVYIDADHSYEAVKSDILAWYPKVKKGGYFGGHDYVDRPGFEGVRNAVNELIKEPLTFYGVSWLINK